MPSPTPAPDYPAGSASTVSKRQAVRLVLAEGHLTPKEAVAHIARRFGLEISPTVFSAYKYQLCKTARQHGGPCCSLADAGAGGPTSPPANLVELTAHFHLLIERFGAKTVRELVEALT